MSLLYKTCFLALYLPPGYGHQAGKGLGLSNRHIGKHLAVYLNPGFLQPLHKLALSKAQGSGRSANPYNPQAPHITLAFPAVNIRIVQRMEHGLMRPPVKGMLGRPVPLG